MRAILLCLILSAGCLAPLQAEPESWPAWQTGTVAFWHPGGDVVIESGPGGRMVLQIVTGQDVRLGTFSAVNGSTAIVPDVPAGELVLDVGDVTMPVRILSGQAMVQVWRPVRTWVQHDVLVQANAEMPSLSPTQTEGAVDVRRPPLDAQLFLSGSATQLEIAVRGKGGILLEYRGPPWGQSILFPFQEWVPIPATATLENAVDGNLTYQIRHQNLQGAVVLETRTYSRAVHWVQPIVPEPNATFRYGTLPAVPVRFEVHPRATGLSLEASEATRVAIFDPSDVLVGRFVLEAGQRTWVPVTGGGTFAAVRLGGEVVLGSDRAPSPFDLHPLEIRRTLMPPAVPGSLGQYGQSDGTTEPEGTLYALAWDGAPRRGGFLACATISIGILQGGEMVGWFDNGPDDLATDYLGQGPMHWTASGFGDEVCDAGGVWALGYVRPA